MATPTISEHISYKEATHSNTATRRGIKNEPNADQLKAMQKVAKKVFEPLRVHFNKPIRVNSFYRSAALNTAIGGSTTSQHCKGEAIDIDAINEITNKQLYDYIRDNLEFDQLIWEFGTDQNPDWVHVSYTTEKPNRKQLLVASIKNGKSVYTVLKQDEKPIKDEVNSTEKPPKEKKVTKEKDYKKGIVKVKTKLNVRANPSTEAKLVGQLKNGKKIKIIGEEKGWYQIKTSKFTGFVSAKYVKIYKK